MAGKSTARKLLTLTEVSKRTGISMPTLQRYKKTYPDRIPSEGSGRTQRYPISSLKVFKELKKENLKRRGRPRKSAATSAASAPKKAAKKVTKKTSKKSAPAKKAAPAAKAKSKGLLTLTEIGKRTGISYPTLLRYVRSHLDRIPHEGTGRARRYPASAISVFKEIRGESGKRRGGGRRKAAAGKKAATKMAAAPRKAAKRVKKATKAAASSGGNAKMAARLQALEKAHRSLVKEINKLQKAVQRPIQVKVTR